MKQFDSSNNPFTIQTGRIPHDRVIDRAWYMKSLYERVVMGNENVIVTGPNGIGKTCILQKFRGLNNLEAQGILSVTLEAEWLRAKPSEFFNEFASSLISTVWTKVFGQSRIALLGVNPTNGARIEASKQIRALRSLYALVRPTSTSHSSTKETLAGLSAPLSINRKEVEATSVTYGPLNSADFEGIIDELVQILAREGFSRVIYWGDETNHMSPEIQVGVFKQVVERFSRKSVGFVLTATEEALVRTEAFEIAIPGLLPVGGFESSADVVDLISSYTGRNIADICGREDEGAALANLIFDATKGHPREIQRILKHSYDRVLSSPGVEFNCRLIFQSCLELYDLRLRQPARFES